MYERLRIIYEDSDLIVLDKPAGLVIHAGTGHEVGLVEILKAFLEGRDGVGSTLHVAPVHRLDRDTSGIAVFGKTLRAVRELGRQLEHGLVEKTYLVLCKGLTHKKGRIDVPLLARPEPTRGVRRGSRIPSGGKHKEDALTEYRRLSFVRGMSLLRVSPKTGRTHQIRRHLRSIGHPVAGDTRWGDGSFNRFLAHRGLQRIFIHAARLKATHPTTGEPLELTAPLPGGLLDLLDQLGFPTLVAALTHASPGPESSRGPGRSSRCSRCR